MKKLLICFVSLGAIAHSLNAVTIHSANGGGNWNVPGSWSPAQVPTSADSVVITAGNPISNPGSSYAIARSIYVQSGSTFSYSGSVKIYNSFRVDGSISGTSNITFSGSANKFISGSATIGGDGNLVFESGHTFINSGTIINRQGYFHVYSGAQLTINGSVTLSAQTITNAGTLNLGSGGTLSVYTQPTLTGTFNPSGSGSTFILSNNCTSVPVPTTSYHNLTLRNGSKTLSGNITVNGNFLVQTSTNFNGNNNTINLAGDYTNQHAGDNNVTNLNLNTIGSSAQSINKPSFSYERLNNLTISSTNTVTLNTGLILSGNMSLASGTLTYATNRFIYCPGDWTNSGGTFNAPNSGNVYFNGSGTQTYSVSSGSNSFFFLQKTGTGTLNLNNSITVRGNFTIAAGTTNANASTINLNANYSRTGGTFNAGTSTVVFQGGSGVTQVVSSISNPETFNNVSKTGIGILSPSVALNLTGNLSLTAGSVNMNSNNLTVAGNATINVPLTNGTNTVTFSGTGAQSISGSATTTFYNLAKSNSGTATFTSGTFNVTNSMVSNTGTLANSGATVTLVSNSSKIAIVGQGTGGYSGTFILQRYISGRPSTWQDMASPVSNSTLTDWDGSTTNEIYMSGVGGPDGTACCPTFYSVYRYHEPGTTQSTAYVAITSVSTALTAGKGYEIYLGDDLTNWTAKVIDTRGTPNFGGLVIPVTRTGGSYDPGANLIGNPYHAHVDLNLATFSNVSSTIYIVDNSGNYPGFSKATTVLPPLQGFWVYATSSSGSVTFAESNKTTTTTTPFGGSFNRIINPSAFEMVLTKNGSEYSHTNSIIINQNASEGTDDDLDARFIRPHDPKTFSLAMLSPDGTYLTSNQINSANQVIVPLLVRAPEENTYRISFNNIATLDMYQSVLLHDKFLNRFIDVRKESSYEFVLMAGENTDRFELILSNKIAESIPVKGNTSVNVITYQEGVQVNIRSIDKGEAVVKVYNTVGQLLFEETILVDEMARVNIPLSDPNSVYLFEVIKGQEKITQKIILNK